MNKTTLDPQFTNLNLFYKKDFYSSASNFLSTIEKYSNELQTAIDYNQTKVQNDVITAQSNFFVSLDEKLKNVQPQFAAFWIKKFNTSLDEIKNQVLIKNGTGTFYRPFSDSIGILTRLENYIDDSTQAISDVTMKQEAPPIRYGSSLSNKLGSFTTLLNGELSKKTNIVFRKNMYNIQSAITTPNKAHGENLIPDILFYQRAMSSIVSFNTKIQNEFKQLYNVIYYYCFYNPRLSSTNIQFAPNINITVNVEGQALNQDALFNQLQDIKSELTTQKMLGLS